MADKNFKRLKRSDLIEMIFELQESEKDLQEEVKALRTELHPEKARMENLPSFDEESLELEDKINHVQTERKKRRKRNFFMRTLSSTIAILIVVAAVAVLIATLFLPVLQVSGSSMEPTLNDGDLILLKKNQNFSTGELIGLRYEGKVLLKRVIGGPGDYITIEEDGTVIVNGETLDEPYVTEKSLGQCDIEFPYQVPENSWFVLGDHRSISVDSRSSTIGCIRDEQIIGEVMLRFWPLKNLTWLQ